MSTSIFEGMSEEELDLIEARIREATSGPWTSFVEGRDHTAGSSFIRTPVSDVELSGATASDQDFIAHARDDLPRLLTEVRRLRRSARSR